MTPSTNLYINPFIIPKNIPDIKVLNEKDFSLGRSKDFYKVHSDACPNPLQEGYQTDDPRTYDSPRAQRLVFDKPALYVKNTQPLQGIYTEENVKGSNVGYYNSYADIKGGQILYYTNLPYNVPYSGPNYVLQSFVEPTIFNNPMDTNYPYYNKIPVFKNNRNISDYSFDQDQMFFREDLMALQSRLPNRSDYSMYNLFNDPSQFDLQQKCHER